MPARATRWCLKEAGLTIREIDGIAFYEDPTQKLARQVWMGTPRVLEPGEISKRLDSRRAEREIRHVLGYEGPIHFVQHHEAHAASAYYFSGFTVRSTSSSPRWFLGFMSPSLTFMNW